MTRKLNTDLKMSGDKPSSLTSLMLEEYLESDGAVTDRLLDGADVQKVIARYGKVKTEVDSLVAIISQIPKGTTSRV
ncbi:hypothetical protein QBC37DRAFT_422795 [Rhypophila decipiens]|uniref:Uncharacterized protein n=1 Tax=Rhypophila decipiens TaxID=261697 RepID=A0AAN6Y812_9PEZI|nr:hypothetical protein QBC37DRAFT_422795 [Rhypophila decipiens]